MLANPNSSRFSSSGFFLDKDPYFWISFMLVSIIVLSRLNKEMKEDFQIVVSEGPGPLCHCLIFGCLITLEIMYLLIVFLPLLGSSVTGFFGRFLGSEGSAIMILTKFVL